MKETLIIESEEYKGILYKALKEEGFIVSDVNDFDASVERMKHNRYNIIILDIDIASEKEGFFQIYRKYAKDSVLIVTCDKKDIEDKLFPVHENIHDIILKPYNIDTVIRNITFIKEKFRSQAYRKTLMPYIKSEAYFKVPSEKIFIEYLSSYVDNFLYANTFDDGSSFRIAFEEAITNAIVHGNHLDKSKFVEVHISIDESEVTISIENEGKGFNYYTAMLKFTDSQENIFKTGGRGLFLISLYTDDFYFEEEGRRVVLKKSRLKAQ